MKIVKAEILWSRKCPLNCQYCNMADGRGNNISAVEWKKGIDVLKNLGCGFIAFYGAEPLVEFDSLPGVVGYAESQGISTTVITSGAVSKFRDKLDVLHSAGARSLSMSYDMVPLGEGSKQKTLRAVENLLYFKSKPNVRDVAAIATLTSTNFNVFPQMAEYMSDKGVWSFFDMIHWDRGQQGTKCKNFLGIDNLKFDRLHVLDLIEMLRKVVALKDQGALVHSSNHFMNMLIKNPELVLSYDWNCADESNFPAWITIDVDMSVYPCDDFQPRGTRRFDLLNLHDEWNKFCEYWKPIVRRSCPGCLWNTHIDAHAIKAGSLRFSDYIHTT